VGKFSLLSPEESLIDGDASPLYERAIHALPDKAGDKQIEELLKVPINQLRLEQVEQTLKPYMESLKWVGEAVKRRRCNWPQWEPGAHLNGYHRLATVIRLWARFEIAGDGYDGAILALQTGFGMGKHLGQASTILEILCAVNIGGFMCLEVEELVQREGSPNLYLALGGLPKPFVDVEKAIEYEMKEDQALAEEVQNLSKTGYGLARQSTRRIDIHVAALQCVEAIRSYAATHGGQLPAGLTDITETPVPKDPISGEPFRYSRTGSTAVLESVVSPGDKLKQRIYYEVAVKNRRRM
jgi:hypothetical protein